MTICPSCLRHYFPELGERRVPSVSIQVEFPHAKAYQREQLVTGICSDKCWSDYLGIGEDDE